MSQITELKRENRLLKEKLAETGISYANIEGTERAKGIAAESFDKEQGARIVSEEIAAELLEVAFG